jgi:cell division protein FtsQ
MPKEPKARKISWRLWLNIAMWSIVFVSTAMAARSVQRFVNTDPRFTLSEEGMTVRGAVYASRARILQAFAPDFGLSIFHVPLAERRRRLLAVDWVADALVSRIWPDRLVVRIVERKPVAFVNLPIAGTSQYRFSLIDEEGVLLSPPPHAKFHFPVLRGVSEVQSEAERKEDVRAMLGLLEDLGPAAKDVSEINVSSLMDLRIVSPIEGRAIELWMGDRSFAARYQNFINHYAEIHKRLPGASTFDLRMDDRITAK